MGGGNQCGGTQLDQHGSFRTPLLTGSHQSLPAVRPICPLASESPKPLQCPRHILPPQNSRQWTRAVVSCGLDTSGFGPCLHHVSTKESQSASIRLVCRHIGGHFLAKQRMWEDPAQLPMVPPLDMWPWVNEGMILLFPVEFLIWKVLKMLLRVVKFK